LTTFFFNVIFPLRFNKEEKVFKEKSSKLHEKIKESRSILITGTKKEDADSISAEILLKIIIEHEFKEKRVEIVNEEDPPEKFKFLLEEVKIFPYVRRKNEKYDLGIVVDCGSERTGKVNNIYKNCGYKVKIDHHSFGNEGNYDLEITSTNVGSTTEIIYHIIKNWNLKLNKRLAKLIYAGLIADTGSFQYDLTKPSSLRICAELLETGFDFTKTAEMINLVRTYEMKKLLGLVLCNMAKSKGGNIIYSYITNEMLKKTGATNSDIGDIIDELCFIKDVEISILLVEEEGGTRVSMRSKGKINVGEFCKKLISTGGGHPRAAGCKLNMSIWEAKDFLLQKLEKALIY